MIKEPSNQKIWMYCYDQEHRKKAESYLLMKQIQAIYREEGKLSDRSPEERLKQRQLVVKPLVDAFFAL